MLFFVLSTTTEHHHHCEHNDNRPSRLSHSPRNQEALMSDLTKRGRGPEEDMNPKRGARFVGFSKKRVADKTRESDTTPQPYNHIESVVIRVCEILFKKNGRRMHWYFSIVKHKVTPNLILNDSDFLQAKFFFIFSYWKGNVGNYLIFIMVLFSCRFLKVRHVLAMF